MAERSSQTIYGPLQDLQRLSDELARLNRHEDRPMGRWMLPALFAALLTGAVGYIGIVHQVVVRNTAKILTISEIQQRNLHVGDDMEEVKHRLVVVEAIVQQMPWLTRQMQDMNIKLDRVLERVHTHRGGGDPG